MSSAEEMAKDMENPEHRERARATGSMANGRRRLLKWLGLGSFAVLLAEIGWIVISFLQPRRVPGTERASTIIVAGAVADFAPGTVTPFSEGAFYLARLRDGGFLAVSRECTHLGCTVPWSAKEDRFACPCHASSFDITGSVLSPPATRPLDLYPVRIENGRVKVDVTQPVRRTRFESSQVTKA